MRIGFRKNKISISARLIGPDRVLSSLEKKLKKQKILRYKILVELTGLNLTRERFLKYRKIKKGGFKMMGKTD